MPQIELVERLSDRHDLTRDYARLVLFRRLLHRLGEVAERGHERASLFVGNAGEILFVALARDLLHQRRAARIGVLHIRTRLAVEVEHFVVAESDVLDAPVVEHRKGHRTHADRLCGRLFVRKVGTFRLDRLQCLGHRGVEHVFEEDDVPAARGQRSVFERHHAVRDVDHVVRPRLAHHPQHLEQLLEVQVLLIGDDIEALGKVVRLFAIDRRRKVARRVQRRAVAAHQKAGRILVLGEADDLSAVALFEQALGFELVEHGLHLVVVEALAGVGIEGHAETVVDPADLFHRDVFEPLEQTESLVVAVLDLLEPRPRLVFELGAFFRLRVEFDIYIKKSAHAFLLDLLAVAPLLERDDKFAELSAPIAQMIDADDVVPERAVDAVERRADRRVEHVPHVEGLGDVDGRIVDANGLARALFAAAVCVALAEHALDDVRRDRLFVKRKVDVRSDRLRLFEEVVAAYPRHDVLCKLRRALAEPAGELEARQTPIAHRRILGARHLRLDLFAVDILKYHRVRKQSLEIHIHLTR